MDCQQSDSSNNYTFAATELMDINYSNTQVAELVDVHA
jgi:hypothetical protein